MGGSCLYSISRHLVWRADRYDASGLVEVPPCRAPHAREWRPNRLWHDGGVRGGCAVAGVPGACCERVVAASDDASAAATSIRGVRAWEGAL
jgi:hypothetical protein